MNEINPFLNPLCNCLIPPGEVRHLEAGFLPIYERYKTQEYKAFNDNVDALFSFSEEYTIDDMYNISYRFNALGFRSNLDYSFSENDQVWVFGDSNTLGAGNPYERVWTNRLPKDYGTIYNLARHGSGVDTAVRYLNTCLEITQHKPKLIVVFGFYPERKDLPNISYIGSKVNLPLGLWDLDDPIHVKREFGLTVEQAVEILDGAEKEYETTRNKFISIATDHNIPVVWPNDYDTITHTILNRVDYGRDVGKDSFVFHTLKNAKNGIPPVLRYKQSAHGGIKTQELYYRFMISEIENQLS